MNSNTQTVETSRTIMLIDDMPDNMVVLEETLSRAGYRIVAISSGETALDTARENPPDLVLLDIRMPGMDGYEVCRQFKADENLRSIPILFMSALWTMDDIDAAFNCGGVDYIAKPFRGPEVLARVRTHIMLREAYAKLAQHHNQLQIIEQHRDTLVHMLVHDMRMPMQVVLGNLELIADSKDCELKPDDLDCLHTAIHFTRLLGRMASAVVDVSRMETGGIPLHLAPVSVSELFSKSQAQTISPLNVGRITEYIDSSCPNILCDANVSIRVLANLLDNAVKYSPEDSKIGIGAEPNPGGVRIWVHSFGITIPLQYRKIIFEKFGVASLPVGERPHSTGLGLAFCKMAVEAQGGMIGVESEAKKGNTFWFTLPSAV